LVLICICHGPRLGLIMQLLKELLPDGMTVPTAYESVGHIAHLNLREEHLPFRHIIAQVHKINFFGCKVGISNMEIRVQD
jgi:hypothetical protein